MKVKSKYNIFIGVLFMTLILINLFIYKSGYTYRPKNYVFFIIIIFAIIVEATVYL